MRCTVPRKRTCPSKKKAQKRKVDPKTHTMEGKKKLTGSWPSPSAHVQMGAKPPVSKRQFDGLPVKVLKKVLSDQFGPVCSQPATPIAEQTGDECAMLETNLNAVLHARCG